MSEPRKPPSQYTDEELAAELLARRQRRGVQPGHADGLLARQRAALDHAKHYASLELSPGSSLDEVEQAFARLCARYEPFLNAPDLERRQAATALLAGLARARDALRYALQTS